MQVDCQIKSRLIHIMREGLKPMSRHHVHLSVDADTAKQVGRRKSNSPVNLKVDTERANKKGIIFYTGNDKVWLADEVPAQFLDVAFLSRIKLIN